MMNPESTWAINVWVNVRLACGIIHMLLCVTHSNVADTPSSVPIVSMIVSSMGGDTVL